MKLKNRKKRRQILFPARACSSSSNCGIPFAWILVLCLLWVFNNKMPCTAFANGRFLRTKLFRVAACHETRLLATISDETSPLKIGIVGGGLAGLSTAFHLLEKKSNVHVTILDKAPVGKGGASSVAGGYVQSAHSCCSSTTSMKNTHICYSSLSLAHDDNYITKISETNHEYGLMFSCTCTHNLSQCHVCLHP